MKISDLFEAYYKPGYKKDSEASQHGMIKGSVSDWLKGMGVSSDDVAAAYEQVKKTPEYKSILALGLKDDSGQGEKKNGTLNFVGKIKEVYSYNERVYNNTLRYKVLANGKITASDEIEQNRSPRAVPKPIVVHGDPVKTVVKTMTSTLKRLHDIISKRQERAKKAMDKKGLK